MSSGSKDENCGENRDGGELPSSLLINSLRSQISKVATLNRFRFINTNKAPLESEREVHMNDIADKIRSQISLNKANKSLDSKPVGANSSEHNEEMYSPLRKRNKSPFGPSLQDEISSFEQRRSEQESILLYNINKLRHDQIKLNNRHINSDGENEMFFPSSYAPLSSMKFMNIQELNLFLSLFYEYGEKKPNLSGSLNTNNLQIIFFTPESISSTSSSTIVTGRQTEKLDDDYLFSEKATISKLILSFNR
ncbi:hypothetical protein OIY81_1467 [Cryptosporidium canis]|uniref:Uncharacterized protein n=1 Tax=Cryptosporidium canis TaxID=195482 RepID=A0ABQ8P8H1_9CRYT|nr:hypothetical protein OJ252_1460 [Cryptosporidium canis]KAJ1612076.1 hypothetical protein OIY81_1467 [Cryptosporidium canis]